MSSPLVISVLDKVGNMKFLCQQYRDYADYDDLRNTVQAFFDIIPPALVVANKNKADEVYCVKEVDVVLGNVNAMFYQLYSSATKEPDATISMSFSLIQKELANYKKALHAYIGREDNSIMKRFARTLEYNRTAPYRWCLLQDKKCVPVLNLRHDVLFEDWVPE
jgi:hypothetical protein